MASRCSTKNLNSVPVRLGFVTKYTITPYIYIGEFMDALRFKNGRDQLTMAWVRISMEISGARWRPHGP